jgi:hypothetical protein
MDKSFALLRTNVGLTTNVKIVITSTYSLYLDSIESHPDLSANKYKKHPIVPLDDYSYLIPRFYGTRRSPQPFITPIEVAYHVRNDEDFKVMGSDFSKQYDNFYNYGAKNIYENKLYSEEFEYFAPLHVTKGSLPTNFIIFRVDGPGVLRLTRNNFRNEILDKMKVVKCFDLTKTTKIGQFLDRNITSNVNLPTTPLYIDFRRNELSAWYGIDYDDGGYISSKEDLNNFFKYERLFSITDKYIYDGWKTKGVVYPFIYNLSFLFDDTPATPDNLKKWSINRYMGFYFDKLELVEQVSPNTITPLEDDAYIDKNNILKSKSGKTPFSDPDDLTNYPYVEVEGIRYKVLECPCDGTTTTNQQTQTSGNVSEDKNTTTVNKCYKIISDKDLEGKSLKPTTKKQGVITISSENGLNTLKYTDETKYIIQDFNLYDMWLIKIEDEYFKLRRDNITGDILIHTDYAFELTGGKFKYYINKSDPKFTKTIKIDPTSQSGPLLFGIYRAKFTEIKDFDTDIIDTKFSKFEYEKDFEISTSEESKFFFRNYNSGTIPPEIHDFSFGNKNVYLPCSSHYTANQEPFLVFPLSVSTPAPFGTTPPQGLLVNLSVSHLWTKNPKYCKWGFRGSNSIGDTEYLLNNSIAADDYNRNPNTEIGIVSRMEKNLDYFYTVNSDSPDYSYHSLHVEDQKNGEINLDFNFELDKYLGISYSLDYFTYFFGKRNELQRGSVIRNDKKWSYINPSNTEGWESGTTLFKGLKFQFLTNKRIPQSTQAAKLGFTDEFLNYKFSILFSRNDIDVIENPSTTDFGGTVINKKNLLNFKRVPDWVQTENYATGSIVRYQGFIYETFTQSNASVGAVNNNPSTKSVWQPYSTPNIIWSKVFDGSNFTTKNNTLQNFGTIPTSTSPITPDPVVYYSGEYWTRSSDTVGNLDFTFWEPGKRYSARIIPNASNPDKYSGVNMNTTVIYDGDVYFSKINLNSSRPSPNSTSWTMEPWASFIIKNGANSPVFKKSTWSKVPLFPGPGGPNMRGKYTVYKGVLYIGLFNFAATSLKVPPSKENTQFPGDPLRSGIVWKWMHSFEPNANLNYGPSFSSNDFISLNGSLVKVDNLDTVAPEPNVTTTRKLDDGVNIYINKKHKNVLINIYSNDGIFESFIKNASREDMYDNIASKFIAYNFMNYINNPFDGSSGVGREKPLNEPYGFINNLKYIFIENDNSIKVYDSKNVGKFLKCPFYISVFGPNDFGVFKNTFKYIPYNFNTNNLKAKKTLTNGIIVSQKDINNYSDVPYAYLIENKNINNFPNVVYSSNLTSIFNSTKRHSGCYGPIFNDVQLFRANGLTHSYDFYKFDVQLTDFGMTGERVISKVNKDGNILKTSKLPNLQAVFPMLDEFGYTVTKSFIFKSTWDYEYLIECNIPSNDTFVPTENISQDS